MFVLVLVLVVRHSAMLLKPDGEANCFLRSRFRRRHLNSPDPVLFHFHVRMEEEEAYSEFNG